MIKAWIGRGMLSLVLLGGAVGISGVGPPSALAIPLSGDYLITSGGMQGTFSIDGTTHLFTAWDLIFPNVGTVPVTTYTSPNPAPNLLQPEDAIGGSSASIHFQDQAGNSFSFYASSIGSPNWLYSIFDVSQQFGYTSFGNIAPVAQPVPEGQSVVLLMIGLLFLAGARWWTHRQERLQLG